jgi:hypothetical protein
VHWGCYYDTALDIEVDSQRCGLGSRVPFLHLERPQTRCLKRGAEADDVKALFTPFLYLFSPFLIILLIKKVNPLHHGVDSDRDSSSKVYEMWPGARAG